MAQAPAMHWERLVDKERAEQGETRKGANRPRGKNRKRYEQGSAHRQVGNPHPTHTPQVKVVVPMPWQRPVQELEDRTAQNEPFGLRFTAAQQTQKHGTSEALARSAGGPHSWHTCESMKEQRQEIERILVF